MEEWCKTHQNHIWNKNHKQTNEKNEKKKIETKNKTIENKSWQISKVNESLWLIYKKDGNGFHLPLKIMLKKMNLP